MGFLVLMVLVCFWGIDIIVVMDKNCNIVYVDDDKC